MQGEGGACKEMGEKCTLGKVIKVSSRQIPAAGADSIKPIPRLRWASVSKETKYIGKRDILEVSSRQIETKYGKRDSGKRDLATLTYLRNAQASKET